MATQGLLVPYFEVRVLIGLFWVFFEWSSWTCFKYFLSKRQIANKMKSILNSTNPILIIAGGIAAIAITVAHTC